MKIECPACRIEIDVTDKLPDTASEETDIDCDCGVTLSIGWYAVAEVRRVRTYNRKADYDN